MTVFLWRLAADTPSYEANDLSGKGAERTGGRWNRPGKPVLYCASTIALAVLETVVHLNMKTLPLNRFLVRVEVPDDCWAAMQIHDSATLPVGWQAIPEGRVSLDIGDQWLVSRTSLLMRVPSVVVPEEANVLLNPGHPDVARVRARKMRAWLYDGRLS